MTDPKDTEGKSKWAPGQNADGSISIHTPEEAAKLVGERDADEEAFEDMLSGLDAESDDFSDLDDPLPDEEAADEAFNAERDQVLEPGEE